MINKRRLKSEDRGGQMSFLEHLDELRKRIVNSLIIVAVAFTVCWFLSDHIYDFLSIPIRHALSEAERRELPVEGITGEEKIVPISNLKEGDQGTYIFDQATQLGAGVVQSGTSVRSKVLRDGNNELWLYTDEPLFTTNAIIPAGVRLPVDLRPGAEQRTNDERMIVTTAVEPFTLYVTVSLYTAIAVSVPLLLLQVWGFISPALYPHEKAYVTPFVLLSSISFIVGVAFAYYILFPPAVKYLLGLGQDFRLLLKASDYLDFIVIIMLAMGIIFQMPAITYVLARIGLVSAGFLLRSWKIAIIVILIVAAFVSPTGDIPNMMLFALPMMVLYVLSIVVAWFFGKKRIKEPAPAAEN